MWTDMEQRGREVEALEVMMRTEGWRIYQRYLAEQHHHEAFQLEQEGRSEALLRHAGALRALRLASEWALNYVQRYRTEVEMEKQRWAQAAAQTTQQGQPRFGR